MHNFFERDLKTNCVVDMEGNQTILYPANGNLGKGDSRTMLGCCLMLTRGNHDESDHRAIRSYFERSDPFFDELENHSLIGVANIFLSCLL
ncbi:kinesin-like protein KIF13B [Carassius auratus]|uniref:Kinesin-like protein KIF13B n=1 Tax=Carassius auratus TaxID=7957 RepID=A0A6P6RLJ5_CARAU|nr:kinesin-like protein KIF13B [Carassius auratus]